MSYNTLETKRKDVLSNFDIKELKKYLFYLTKEYYEAYVNNDEERFSKAVNLIYEIIDEYGDSYANLEGFLFYCLYLNANLIILNNLGKQNDFKLLNLMKYDLYGSEDYEEELSHDIQAIFNKERIRERYNEKRISEFIE